MTDITELAQREKFEAWWERTQHNGNPPRFGWSRLRDGEGYKVDDSELDGMWEAWKAASAELLEALEEAQAVMNAVVTAAAIRGVRPFDGIDCDPPTLEENAEACGDAMSARIRELEANPPKPHHNGLMQISNELAGAKQRIAELERQKSVLADGVIRAEQWLLESRTVKLPQRHSMLLREDFNDDYHTEMAYKADEVQASLDAAGIKVEAE